MVLSWGKPTIVANSLDGGGGSVTFPTPAEGTTQLETTKGDKKEAKVEGGEIEDVKYSKNSYSLKFSIRQAKGRSKPIADVDGIIEGNYSVTLTPEDADNGGFTLNKCTVSVEDTWSAEEGGMWTYTFDALKPESGPQISWGGN